MKVSIGWLKKYVDINVPIAELCDKMVMSGFEIDGIEDLSECMKNVVAAKILKLEKHPDADKLQICTMDIGTGNNLQIVTGAQNVFEGAVVPAALNDSLLPNGMKIKTGKLRGVVSEGMLCSGEELNLKEEDYPGAGVYGILILDDSIKAGTDMRDVLNLNDCIIDFKVTANRPDCNCVLGLAREIAVALKTEFKAPVPEFKTIGGDINDFISVKVEDAELCPRYLGRAVKNLKIGPSPEWLKIALRDAGMRSINNIVDITNFVMLETGQPMHAFDRRDIAENKIIVRRAKAGEKITTLDEKDHDLTPDMLVIADGVAPSCVAGIMGGLNSEIKDDTTDLFLECAKFRRDSVRKTARALGMRTESSARYEKGTDINNVEYAMNRALQLIYELGAGDIIDGEIDCHNGLPAARPLSVKIDSINGLLGIEVSADDMVDILNRLGINTAIRGEYLDCLVPSFRDDIEGMADIAEEVIRIYGCDHIHGTMPKGALTRGTKLAGRMNADKIKALLCSMGINEIKTYSFIGSKAIDVLNLDAEDSRRNVVSIINPLSDEYSTMRTQLITNMLSTLATNYNRKNDNAKYFELDKVFIPNELPVASQPQEKPTLCIGFCGGDFFELKGIIEKVVELFGAKAEYEAYNENFMHPFRCAEVKVGGERLAVMGEIHPDVADKYSIDARVYIAEIDLSVLYNLKKDALIFKPLPKFPAVTRDLALLCDEDTPIAVLNKAISEGAGKLCEKIVLFDVYQGAQIPDGKKSVAFSIVLRSKEATLTDEETVRAMNKVIKKLEAVGATVRQ